MAFLRCRYLPKQVANAAELLLFDVTRSIALLGEICTRRGIWSEHDITDQSSRAGCVQTCGKQGHEHSTKITTKCRSHLSSKAPPCISIFFCPQQAHLDQSKMALLDVCIKYEIDLSEAARVIIFFFPPDPVFQQGLVPCYSTRPESFSPPTPST